MNVINNFSCTYAEARNQFLNACKVLNAAVEHHIHPEIGREGEVLATDVARIGPDCASHVLITMSATHGVEGFCGSGVQIGALRSGLYDNLPANLAVVIIHAINPFGFSWLRRVTHENVDLNRNHLNHNAPYPVNEGYELLHDAICPKQWTAHSQASTKAVLDAYAKMHGDMALQAAISGGQYSKPRGLFFGGNSTTWSARTMSSAISRHTDGARHVGFIDYHTGLGPYGYGEQISSHAVGEPSHDRLLEWLGEDQVTSIAAGTSSSALVTGVNNRCVAKAAPHTSHTMVTLEFGTSPLDKVFDSLRADCWLHNYGELNSDQGRAIKKEIRRCFYPDTDDWKTLVWEHASKTERKVLLGLSSLP